MKLALAVALCVLAACTKKPSATVATPAPVVETTSGGAEAVESVETTQTK